MWVPAHVLRTDVRLRVPRPWPLCQSDGFEQVVSFVDRLAVCRLSQAVQKTNREPPSVRIGRFSVEGLGQPRGGQAVDDAASDVFHPLCQPTPMHFVGVIGQAHAVGHDEVDDLVQVALEGPSVRLQQRERRSGHVGRCVGISGGKSGSISGGARSGHANVPRSRASDIIVAVCSNTASSNGALVRFTAWRPPPGI